MVIKDLDAYRLIKYQKVKRYSETNGTPLNKANLKELNIRLKNEKKRYEELSKAMHDLGVDEDYIQKVEEIKKRESVLEQKRLSIVNDKKNYSPSKGLIAFIFNEKELSESASKEINLIRFEIDKLVFLKKKFNDKKIQEKNSLIKAIQYVKEKITKIDQRIKYLSSVSNDIEQLRNKAAKSTLEKRSIAVSVKKSIKKNKLCPYCGSKLDLNCHADHIYPVSKGGESRAKNMVFVCASCNTKKSNLTLNQFIKKYKLDREFIEKNLEKLKKEF